MKIRVEHWMGPAFLDDIPGVFFEPSDDKPLAWIDIPLEDFGKTILELSKSFDIMIQNRDNDEPLVWFDNRGRRFRAR